MCCDDLSPVVTLTPPLTLFGLHFLLCSVLLFCQCVDESVYFYPAHVCYMTVWPTFMFWPLVRLLLYDYILTASIVSEQLVLTASLLFDLCCSCSFSYKQPSVTSHNRAVGWNAPISLETVILYSKMTTLKNSVREISTMQILLKSTHYKTAFKHTHKERHTVIFNSMLWWKIALMKKREKHEKHFYDCAC